MSVNNQQRQTVKRLPSKPRVTRRQIAAAARHIAREFNPEKIILFGSYAYGKPTPDSDVDLLVIMKDRLPWPKQETAIYKSFNRYPFAMDIIVETPKELARKIRSGDPFACEINQQGQTLYERRI